MPGGVQTQPQPHGMPRAPQGRNDELQSGGPRTVYEFSGGAAGATSSSKGTFVGATLDLSGHREHHDSNLRSGASTWLLVVFGLLFGGGLTAWFVMGQGSAAGNKDEASQPAVAAAEDSGPDAAAASDSDGAAGAGGSGSGGEVADGSGTAGAADAKADDAKAEVPEPAAAEPKPAEPEPEPKPAEPKPATTTKKKTATRTKKTTKPTTTTPTTTNSGGGGGGKTLKSKKPPRDPLKGLPKPPGE